MKRNIATNIEKRWGYLVIDGKFFKEASVDGKPCFALVPKKEINKHEKMAEEIAMKIETALDSYKVLKESIMLLDFKEIEKLNNILKKQRNYKAKTRDHRCVDMKVGNFILPVVR